MNRLLKRWLVLLLAVFPLLIEGQTRPNVLLILTDDQGSLDLNCYGAADLHTPHLDQLAADGVRFDQCYVAAPLCSPSRAALLTGKNPHAAGLPNNASSFRGNDGMPTEQFTLAEALQKEGYATAHIGKWHLGFSPETMPLGQGFDYSYGHMGGCIDNYSHFFYWNGPNRHDLFENGEEIWKDGAYFPDLMTEKAVGFIEENQENPFFLYYAINLPHYPLQPAPKWRDWYKDKDLPQPRKDYAAFVSTIDERIGILLHTLDSLQLRENTLIVFLSDHGHSVEQRAFNGGGFAGPYRGAKGSLFEGGIRVPAIVSLHSAIPTNEIRHQLVSSMDWFPTILDYCNITIPTVEGKSIKQVIENKESPASHDQLFWKQGVSWAIRKGDWKLMGYPNDPTDKTSISKDDLLFLSNLKLDISEHENLTSKYPAKVAELLEAYKTWDYAVPEDIPTQSLSLPSIAKNSPINLKHIPHPKYAAKGAISLLDEQVGSRQFTDGQWLGFERTDLEAVIQLEELTIVEEIIIGALQDAGVWIFLPKFIEISWSKDGKAFSKPIHLLIDDKTNRSKKLVKRIAFTIPKITSKYFKIKVKSVETCPSWHSAAGQPAWLFIDEITFRGDSN